MPRGFAFPDRQAEAWQPMLIAPVVSGTFRSLMIFSALARLRPGVTPAQAAAEATGRALGGPDVGPAGFALFGNNGAPALVAARAVDVLTADIRPSLLLLLAAVALLFVTAVASVVLLQMARAASRRREMAVRMAIGAGVGRVARGWMIESLVLAAGVARQAWHSRGSRIARCQDCCRVTSPDSTTYGSIGPSRCSPPA